MIIRLILGSKVIFQWKSTTETPILVILRDLFYSGDWRNMKRDFESVPELYKQVKCLKRSKRLTSQAR